MNAILAAMLEQGEAEGWTDGTVAWFEGGLFALVQSGEIRKAEADKARRLLGVARLERLGWAGVSRQAAERLRP